MGTNYYLLRDVCGHCLRERDRLHIGKSSVGWCFALHVEPGDAAHPQNLEEWRRAWSMAGAVIRNEYGDSISPAAMDEIVTKRGWEPGAEPNRKDFDYAGNYAQPGPRGLVRSAIGRYCVGHGDGTWDLIPGEFS